MQPIRLLRRLALAVAATVGLYVTTLGLPLPSSCAAPSRSCGGDLRECLRLSADMRQTTFGGRYVTAEDVARCMEGFDACIHGGAASGGGNSPSTPATSRAKGQAANMPPRRPFSIADSLDYDCRVDGDAVSCDITRRDQLPETMDSWTATFTGTLSGSTMSGTQTTRTRSHYTAVACVEESEGIEPISYTFNPDGTVRIKSDGIKWHTSNCSESHDNTTPGNDTTANWS